LTGFLVRLSIVSAPRTQLGCLCRYQPPAQSIQVRQADQHHHLGGVLRQPAIAHPGVAELPLDDPEQMLDTRPDAGIPPIAFLLAAGERRAAAVLGLGLVLDASDHP